MNSRERTKDIQSVKDEIRVLAIKDVPLGDQSKTLWIIGVVFRGKYWLDGIMRTQIPAEKSDATQSLVEMIRVSPHYDQIRVIMLDNMVFGGQKVVDINELYEKTLKPVILLAERKPSPGDMLEGRRETAESDLVLRALEKMGEGIELSLGERGQRFMWNVGLSNRVAERIVRKTTLDGDQPEALKVASLISSAFLQILME